VLVLAEHRPHLRPPALDGCEQIFDVRAAHTEDVLDASADELRRYQIRDDHASLEGQQEPFQCNLSANAAETAQIPRVAPGPRTDCAPRIWHRPRISQRS
jgi:hypothetical protein